MTCRAKLVVALFLGTFAAPAAVALDRAELLAPNASDRLRDSLRGASLVLEAQREGRTEAQDVFAAAQADYGRLLGALYAAGHYSGVISIRIDGREAGDIAPLNAPGRIREVVLTVDPGPPFAFGEARIAPLAPGTELPAGFAAGEPAVSGVIGSGVEAATTGWREAGHPKAQVRDQAIIADHRAARLDARIAMAPGRQARLGQLTFTGQERMRPERLHAIAGFPTGEVFTPEHLRRSADRLRRTGAFRAITMTEAEEIAPDGTLDVAAAVIEETPRRIGFGAELASFDGLTLTGYWMHRNLLGGAEQLRFDARIAQIGARRSGTDYSLGVSFERPATFTPDTTLGLSAEIARLDEEDHVTRTVAAGARLTHIFSDRLTARGGLEYRFSRVDDSLGSFTYRTLSLPLGLTWDARDNQFDARSGTYLDAEIAPFAALGGSGNGARLVLDGRAYRAMGDRIVLAGRVQAGAVFGPDILDAPRDDLFYSGGGGTVRGQPYQSLGVDLPGTSQRTGGNRFVAASAEVRARITDKIGLVGFYDIGRVGASGIGGSSATHAGAGLGLRYATGIGPIRLDVAGPVSGDTGNGVHLYIGIGQAF
ncbi:MAG: autotransporter assembly complex family protein [Gemmobacter sp.]